MKAFYINLCFNNVDERWDVPKKKKIETLVQNLE